MPEVMPRRQVFYSTKGRIEESAAEAQKAIELNPSDMFAYFLLCGAENGAGKPENAYPEGQPLATSIKEMLPMIGLPLRGESGHPLPALVPCSVK
jgi:hypothetical protein